MRLVHLLFDGRWKRPTSAKCASVGLCRSRLRLHGSGSAEYSLVRPNTAVLRKTRARLCAISAAFLTPLKSNCRQLSYSRMQHLPIGKFGSLRAHQDAGCAPQKLPVTLSAFSVGLMALHAKPGALSHMQSHLLQGLCSCCNIWHTMPHGEAAPILREVPRRAPGTA